MIFTKSLGVGALGVAFCFGLFSAPVSAQDTADGDDADVGEILDLPWNADQIKKSLKKGDYWVLHTQPTASG